MLLIFQTFPPQLTSTLVCWAPARSPGEPSSVRREVSGPPPLGTLCVTGRFICFVINPCHRLVGPVADQPFCPLPCHDHCAFRTTTDTMTALKA